MRRFLAGLLLALSSSFAAFSQGIAPEVRDATWQEVQQSIASDRATPVVIEFYNSRDDGMQCDHCAGQPEIFERVAQQYRGQVRFFRVDVSQVPHLVETGVVGIYPTHLFIDHEVAKGQEFVARRIRGFLTEDQFKELIAEFFLVPAK